MKKILILVLCFIPVFIDAKTYILEDGIYRANNNIHNYADYNDYIVTDGNIKYNYDNGVNKLHVNFKKGGFLSRYEYEITNVNYNSYLSSGLEYWTLTQHSFDKNYVISFGTSSKDINDKSNVRVTNFVKDKVKIGGSGTRENPWYFIDILNVTVYSSDVSRGKLSLKPCDVTSDDDKKKSIGVQKYEKSDTNFYVCEDYSFRFRNSTCDDYIKYDSAYGYYVISGDIKDNSICRIDFSYNTYVINLNQCNDCGTKTSPTKVYLAYNKNNFFRDQYGDKTIDALDTIPTKKGYTFQGYYTKSDFSGERVINESGSFVSKNINSNVTLYPYMKANTYTVKYDCNGGVGVSDTSSHTYNQKSNLKNVSCYKEGYTFAGWSTAKDNVAEYTNGAEVNNLTDVNGATVNLYAVWNPCAKGYYNNTEDPNKFSCEKCGVGTYSDAVGSATCKNCPGDYTSDAGSTAVSNCYIDVVDGKYIAEKNSSVQTNCAAGTFKAAHRVKYGEVSSCQNCATCKTNTEGSVNCPITITYKVSYNGNGGSGVPGEQTKTCGTDLTLSNTIPTRSGYVFDGWNTNSSGSGTNYESGGKYSSNSAATLYAKWKVSRVYLVQNGVTQSIVGGWQGKGQKLTSVITNHDPLVTYQDGNYLMFVHDDWKNTTGGSYSKNKIDMTNYSKLRFEGTLYSGTMEMGGSLRIHSSVGSHVDDGKVMSCWTTAVQQYKNAAECDFDISGLSGSYYVGVHMFGNGYYNSGSKSNNYVKIKNMWLE